MVDDPLGTAGRAPGSGGAAPALPLTSRQDASLQTDDSAAPAVEVELAISGDDLRLVRRPGREEAGQASGSHGGRQLSDGEGSRRAVTAGRRRQDSILVGTVVKAGYGATVLRRIRVGADGQREASAGVDAAEAEAAAARASFRPRGRPPASFLRLSGSVGADRRGFHDAGLAVLRLAVGPRALSVPVALWCAWPFHRAAWRAGRHGSTTMDTLVSLGIVASMGWSLVGPAGRRGRRVRLHDAHDGHPRPRARGSAASVLRDRRDDRDLPAAGEVVGSAVAAFGGRRTEVASRARSARGDARAPGRRHRREEVVEPGASRSETSSSSARERRWQPTAWSSTGASAVDASLLTGESVPVDVSAGTSVTGATSTPTVC